MIPERYWLLASAAALMALAIAGCTARGTNHPSAAADAAKAEDTSQARQQQTTVPPEVPKPRLSKARI